jgi:two-component system, NtrC family, sensor kinase
VPAITELAQLDATGKERLRVSRLAMDVVASGSDLSSDPKFAEAAAKKVYYGPVYFRRESEPYLTLAIAGARRDAGVSVAEKIAGDWMQAAMDEPEIEQRRPRRLKSY